MSRIAAALVVIGVFALRPQAQQPTAVRMADVNVPGPADAVSLAIPATPYAAFNALVRVLEASGVRYGVEGPASDPAKPPIDFAHEFERAVPLAGRPLRDALDAIVHATPQFHWSDAAGSIVVRAGAGGDGILDRRLARFAISNATPREALEALIAALDPAREKGLGIRARSNGAPAPRKVTLSLRDVTVQTALTTLAHEYGTLSWTVKYDAAPAGVATAAITFTTPDGVAIAQSPTSLRAQALDPDGRWRLGIGSELLRGMLLAYAERTGVRINIEEAASAQNRTFSALLVAGLPPLELPDNAEQAVERIVAFDSRYQWSQKGGGFLVTPKPGVSGRSGALDRTLADLQASGEAAGSVIARVMAPIGSMRRTSGASIGLGSGAIDQALSTPIDVHRPGPITIRDALNMVADATGWMWSTRAAPPRPSGSQTDDLILMEWRGRGQTQAGARRGSPVPPGGNADTWSVVFAISASPVVTLATPSPPSEIAASDDRPAPPVPRPYLALPVTGESLRRAIDLIARNYVGVPIGLEVVASSTPGAAVVSSRDRYDLSGLTIENTFEKIQDLATDYLVTLDKGVYHVRPRDAQRDSTPWLNVRVARFQRQFADMREALAAVARVDWPRDAPAATVAPPPSERMDALMKTPVAISLTDVSVRDILDEIARKQGSMYWVVEQRVAVSGPLVRVTFAGNGWSVITTVR